MSQLTNLVFVSLFGCVAATAAVMQLQDRKQPQIPAQSSSVQANPNQAKIATVQSVAPAQSQGNTAMLYADPRGHFFADIQVRGVPVRTLVDTGASLVAMSTEDAAKVGLRAQPGDKQAQFNTANGMVTASLVRLPEVRLQGIMVFDVEAAIMPPGAMQGTLLGMSFMKKLASFESRGTSLVMRK
jgi:aspartyl protease family protein